MDSQWIVEDMENNDFTVIPTSASHLEKMLATPIISLLDESDDEPIGK